MLRSIVAVALTLCTAGCEAGLTGPKDAGTVHGRVRDQTGAPAANVPFSVESPNSNGSTFWETIKTRSDGTVTMEGIPAGTHRTWVTPPAGYARIPDSLTKVRVGVEGTNHRSHVHAHHVNRRTNYRMIKRTA